MMIDTDIISDPAMARQVMAECCRINFPDGHAIGLHLVTFNGVQQMFLRAVPFGDGLFVVFDLRDPCPPLGEDIPSHHWHDTDGLVIHHFRLAYPDHHEALAAMTALPIDVLKAAPKRQAIAA